MRELSYHDFTALSPEREILEASIDLTYRCNLKCVHCFTTGCSRRRQLSLGSWKRIIDTIHRAGCLWLTLTGGEPLLYKDFLALYRYAVRKGMRVTVFTNATLLTPEVLAVFLRERPFMIEVSLYGVTRRVHESVTRAPGSFEKTIAALRGLAIRRIPATIKTVGLRQNRREVLKIKSFSERLFGKGKFKFDSVIFPRLNGDTGALKYRLSPGQVLDLENADKDMTRQRRREAERFPKPARANKYLYWCASWRSSFSIDPSGVFSFCNLSRVYRYDLNKTGFRKAFFKMTPRIHDEEFSRDTKCRQCSIRVYCYSCPARAYLETGDREEGSGYFCRLARARKGQYEALAARGVQG